MALKMNKYIDTVKTVCVSGYFIWLHAGHIQYLKEASEIGRVIVILNNDNQQILKYGKVIVPLQKRAIVIKSIVGYVDTVVRSIDQDRTVCMTLVKIRPDIFFNGGDRTSKNIPEVETCEQLGIQMIFGSGGKILSSSDLLSKL